MTTQDLGQDQAVDDGATGDPQQPDLLPIRDVARITGVNPVTLRAWERRYGLIVPHRTPKGHRLYDADHVAKIQAILTWIDRGVTIGQVKGLLRDEQPAQVEIPSFWGDQRQHLVEAISNLDERRLDDCFNSALSLYPPQTLCQQLLLPLFDQLELRWRGQFGAQAERVFFHSWLRSKLGSRVYHANRQRSGRPLLLINLSDRVMEPGLWLTAWLTSDAGYPVNALDWPIPPNELALAVEHIQPRALLLYSSQALKIAHLPHLVTGYDCPSLIIVPTVHIQGHALRVLMEGQSSPQLADSPLTALHMLTELNLLDS
ncbi:MAG: MerR family transcriptional regulator [Pseudomonas sp.]|uniref:MerR family transcriptional regulator n=1 Tax=Pseudomonas sp. TaxID=306 RepID=UPI003D0EEC4C